MKKSTKKKILTLALVLALLAIVTVGGSLAWFTAEDSAKNTFTVGSVEIRQLEQQENENGELEDFEQGKQLLPIVNINDPAADPNYQQKIVSVENFGKNDAYVQTHIAIPTKLVGYIKLDLDFENDAGQPLWEDVTPEQGNTVEVDGVSYTVYTYRYMWTLVKETKTEPILRGVYMDAAVDIKNNAEGQPEYCKPNGSGGFDFSEFPVGNAEINVLVASQAVQKEGFGSAEEALEAAFGVLPEGYPDFTKVK